jgi:hypothetical protein
MDDEISVKELIQKISEDLLESEEERTARGQRPVFEVSELTVELAFVASRSRQGRGGVDLHVVSVGGDAGSVNERAQRMTLRLIAVGGGEERAGKLGWFQAKRANRGAVQAGADKTGLTRLDYDDVLPVRPRLRGRQDS